MSLQSMDPEASKYKWIFMQCTKVLFWKTGLLEPYKIKNQIAKLYSNINKSNVIQKQQLAFNFIEKSPVDGFYT